MTPEWRILEKTYYNEYGNKATQYYIIQYKKKFLWFSYWKYITHKISCMSDTFDAITEFDNIQQAKDFAEKNICGNGIYDKFDTKIINQNE
jgi:hypothetical protein